MIIHIWYRNHSFTNSFYGSKRRTVNMNLLRQGISSLFSYAHRDEKMCEEFHLKAMSLLNINPWMHRPLLWDVFIIETKWHRAAVLHPSEERNTELDGHRPRSLGRFLKKGYEDFAINDQLNFYNFFLIVDLCVQDTFYPCFELHPGFNSRGENVRRYGTLSAQFADIAKFSLDIVKKYENKNGIGIFGANCHWFIWDLIKRKLKAEALNNESKKILYPGLAYGADFQSGRISQEVRDCLQSSQGVVVLTHTLFDLAVFLGLTVAWYAPFGYAFGAGLVILQVIKLVISILVWLVSRGVREEDDDDVNEGVNEGGNEGGNEGAIQAYNVMSYDASQTMYMLDMEFLAVIGD